MDTIQCEWIVSGGHNPLGDRSGGGGGDQDFQ